MTKSKKVLCAVSGGPDSMALLNKCKNEIFCVCHVNYNHRPTALRDTNIVKKYCLEHKIKLEILNVDKKLYKKYEEKHNLNFENIARNMRYDFFVKVSKKYKVNRILIAHNKDDFLETCIMQKNKNINTLFYGIKKENKYQSLNIFRPLIDV
jgi:tRNA(Ile)-lysidine synthase